MNNPKPKEVSSSQHECVPVPPFKRLNYHYGQMLGARDFQTEQDYFRHKLMLQNRCLHGYGVVCGLLVEPTEPGPPEPPTQQHAQQQQVQQTQQVQPAPKCPTRVRITCGLALDICGRELVVRDELCVDLWKLLSKEEQDIFANAQTPCPLYIVLCYDEIPIDKQPVEFTEHCLASNPYTYAKVCESVCVRVTLQPPPPIEDEPCEPCCTPYEEKCLWLARIDNFKPYEEIDPKHIHNEIRRPLSTYRPTTITGINWVHGGQYTESEAEDRLEEGLLIQFSRPVLAHSLKPGIMDIWVTDDWSGPSSGAFRSLSHHFAIPVGQHTVTDLSVRVECRGLKGDERVLIVLRSDFILDQCCQPVDGNHVGGWAPNIGPDKPKPLDPCNYDCPELTNRLGLWQSGNGIPGGTFESWFFVSKPDKYSEKKR